MLSHISKLTLDTKRFNCEIEGVIANDILNLARLTKCLNLTSSFPSCVRYLKIKPTKSSLKEKSLFSFLINWMLIVLTIFYDEMLFVSRQINFNNK